MAITIYTLTDIRRRLKVGKTTAYRLIRDGQLEYFKIGRSIRVTEEALNNYIASHSVKKNE